MSGIYIPGLSMPRKTGIVSIVLSGDGSALLCEDGAYSEIKVIPVPPHGRLIDADEFFKALTMDDRVSILEAMHIQSILSDAPTIIPASEEGDNGT